MVNIALYEALCGSISEVASARSITIGASNIVEADAIIGSIAQKEAVIERGRSSGTIEWCGLASDAGATHDIVCVVLYDELLICPRTRRRERCL